MPSWPELRQQLYLALLDGFGANDLKHMLRYECENRRLETIVSLQHDLSTIIVAVIDNAERKQWIEQLAAGANRFNPSNKAVADIASQIAQLHRANPQAFYAQVEQTASLIEVMPSQQIQANSGAIAIGQHSTAVGERAINITGVNYGNITTRNSDTVAGTRNQLDQLFTPLIVALAQKVPSPQLPQALQTVENLKNALSQPVNNRDLVQIASLRDTLASLAPEATQSAFTLVESRGIMNSS